MFKKPSFIKILVFLVLILSMEFAQAKKEAPVKQEKIEKQERSLVEFYVKVKEELKNNKEIAPELKKKLVNELSPENFLNINFEKQKELRYKNQRTLDVLFYLRKKYEPELNQIQEIDRREKEKIQKNPLATDDKKLIAYRQSKLAEVNKNYSKMSENVYNNLKNEIAGTRSITPEIRKKFHKELSAENFLNVNFEAIKELNTPQNKPILDTLLKIKSKHQPVFQEMNLIFLQEKEAAEKSDPRLEEIESRYTRSMGILYNKLRLAIAGNKELKPNIKKAFLEEFASENFFTVDFQRLLPELKTIPDLKDPGDVRIKTALESIDRIKKKYVSELRQIQESCQEKRDTRLIKLDSDINSEILKAKEKEIIRIVSEMENRMGLKELKDQDRVDYLYKDLWSHNLLDTEIKEGNDSHKAMGYIKELKKLQSSYKKKSGEILKNYRDLSEEDISLLLGAVEEANKNMQLRLNQFYKNLLSDIYSEKELNPFRKQFASELLPENFMGIKWAVHPALEGKNQRVIDSAQKIQKKHEEEFRQIQEESLNQRLGLNPQKIRENSIEKKYRKIWSDFYKKLQDEIHQFHFLNAAAKKTFSKELNAENFLKTDFEKIPDFFNYPKKLQEEIGSTQKKYLAQYEKIKEAHERGKRMIASQDEGYHKKIEGIEKNYQQDLIVFYNDLEDDIVSEPLIDPAIRKKYSKEFLPENFLKIRFDLLEDLKFSKVRTLETLERIQKKYQAEYNDLKEAFFKDQKEAGSKSGQVGEKSAGNYQKKMQELLKKKDKEIFLDKNISLKIKNTLGKDYSGEKFLQAGDFREIFPELKEKIDFQDANDKKLALMLDCILAMQARNQARLSQMNKRYEKQKSVLEQKQQQEHQARVAASIEKANKIERDELRAAVKRKKEDQFVYNFSIGIKGGVNFSGGAETKEIKAMPGWGIQLEYLLFRIRSIAFESALEMDINYIKKPAVLEKGTVNCDYINIPVLIKGKFPANIPLGIGEFSPFIGIGIDPYFNLTSSFLYTGTEPSYYGSEYKYEIKKFTFGFVWNLGGELNILDLGVLSLEFRMSLGATPGFGGTLALPLDPVAIPEQKQNGYMFLIGWKMYLGSISDLF